MSGEDELEDQKMEIRKTIVIDASPEVVFNAITEPEQLTQWFPDQAKQSRTKNWRKGEICYT